MNKETEAMNVGEKLKIAHVLKSSIYSGAENVVLTIMKGLREEFEFLYIATEGPIREKLKEEQVPFKLLERFDRKYLSQALNEYQPDIVHAHDFSATVLCAAVPGRFRLISHLHYDPPWTRKWNLRTITYRMCDKRIERILAVSGRSFSNMVFEKQFRNKMTVMGNPIDIAKIQHLAEKPLEEDGVCDVIFVGRLVEQKDPLRFIRIVGKLKKEGFHEVKAWILGNGELEEACLESIEQLGLEDNIELKGFRNNPYPYIKRSKVLCMTSKWEGFGLVLVEAKILGVPVVSSRTAGAEEVLGTGTADICDTDTEFVDKIKQILCRAELCEEIEKREEVDLTLSLETYMEKLKKVYQSKDR